MVCKELKDLYDLAQEIDEEYKKNRDWFKDQNEVQYNIALIFADYIHTDRGVERALRLAMTSMRLLEDFNHQEKYEDAVSNLFMLLLENDPTLYTNLNKAFYKLIQQSANEYTKEMIEDFKHNIDVIQTGIKEKEYKTPFYNVIETEEEYNKSFGKDPQFEEGENI